jgi:hypothetical protein
MFDLVGGTGGFEVDDPLAVPPSDQGEEDASDSHR